MKEIIEKRSRDDRLKALDLLANPEYMKIRQRKALETAYEFIGDPDELIRGKVIALIGLYGEKEDALALIPLLQKEEKRNLQAVVDALGALGNAEVLPHLVAMMETNHAGIKLAVINAMGRFEEEQCIEPLIEAFA